MFDEECTTVNSKGEGDEKEELAANRKRVVRCRNEMYGMLNYHWRCIRLVLFTFEESP